MLIYCIRVMFSAHSIYYVLWFFIFINFLTAINKLLEVRFGEHSTSLVIFSAI